MSRAPRKLAFVIPWYGNTTGGAEVFCRGLAHALAGLGHEVTVLTTCCRDPFHDWGTNHLPAGESEDNGVRVIRFPVRRGDMTRYVHYSVRLDRGEELSDEEEEDLIANSINSEALCEFISAHRNEYAFFFLPYLYGTTYYGIRAAGRNHAYLIPCLHNEPFAYLKIMQEMFERTRGLLFLSPPERDLASALYPIIDKPSLILGGGVNSDVTGDASDFRERFGIEEPFALFVGRKVPGKGADLLVRYFSRYLELYPKDECRLVLIGKGDLEIPKGLRERIVDLQVDSPTDVYNAMAACQVFIQPSFFESFSLVLMEAWLNSRPVLVNGQCEVTLYHVHAANGGLYFTDFGEFVETFRYLWEFPLVASALGKSGKRYVEENYLWPNVARRFHRYVERFLR